MTTEFSSEEFENRIERARVLMTDLRLDAFVVTSEENVEYLAGFLTDSWVTPTRPFYFLLPRSGNPTAIIPQGGELTWQLSSWVERIVTWPAPRPENEGVDEVVSEFRRIQRRYGRFGIELGPESRIGMTLGDVLKLIEEIKPTDIADCSGLCRELRIIKSDAEIARIRRACEIASDAFDALPGFITPGSTEIDVAGRFKANMILAGAEKVPFTGMSSGNGGYETIITRPSSRQLGKGDILVIDTGAKYEGYFCDFDRNFSIGEPPGEVNRMNELLFQATAAGIEAARPDNTAAELYLAQAKVIEDAGIELGRLGRFGHGLGKALTEWPSNKIDDHTVLRPGMVMTIEPAVAFGDGKFLVHEEDLVITDDGCTLLSRRASPQVTAIEW